MYNARNAGLAVMLFALMMPLIAISQTTTMPTSTIPFSSTASTTVSTTMQTTVPASTTVSYSSTVYTTSTAYTTEPTSIATTTVSGTSTVVPTTTIPISSTIVPTTTIPGSNTTVPTTTIQVSSTIVPTTTIPGSSTSVPTTTIPGFSTTIPPTTTINFSTTVPTTTTIPSGTTSNSGSIGNGAALPGIPSGYGAPVSPASISKSGASCYNLTSISERSPFSVSIGNQSVGLINSYISQSGVGITINNQRYQLSLNQPMKIPGTDITITLTSVSLQSTVSTASFEVCGPSVPFIPPSQRVVNVTFSISPFVIINRSNSSVYAYNVPANLPMAPNGFRIIAIDNISANAMQFGIINVMAQYNCSLKGISPFLLSQSAFSWNALNYSYRNSSASCALRFSVPNDPVIAIMQNLKAVVPERPAGNQTNATGTLKPKPISYNVIIASIAIIVGAILLILALMRKDGASNAYKYNESTEEYPKSVGQNPGDAPEASAAEGSATENSEEAKPA